MTFDFWNHGRRAQTALARGLAAASQFALRAYPTRPLRGGRINVRAGRARTPAAPHIATPGRVCAPRTPHWLVAVCTFFALALTSFADDPGITVSARQRYPWNGLVDLKFTITGTSGTKYDTSFTAKDIVGNTNIAMQTIRKADGTAANVEGEVLYPGTYHWVWDAAADLPDGFQCERVTVTGTANEFKPLYMVIDLSGGANASSYPVSYLDAVPDGGWTDEYKTTKLVLRRIEPGTFTMDGYGSSNTHKVTLTKAYYIGIFEVTQAQYLRVMGVNPSYHVSSGEASPVEDVYWTDLRGAATGIQFPSDTSCDSSSFFGIMRSRTSLSFLDLPTEAQWQYACMGNGTLGGVAESGTTRIVGTKSANGLGLYDMQGNVDEWMIDLWKQYGTGDCIDPEGGTSGTVRIIKGGYYGQTGSDPCNKVGFRCNENQACRHQYTGFRVCMTLQ